MGNCGLGGHAHFKHVVKLVHNNGLIEEFYRPVKAGEILVDYPQYFICPVDSLSQLMVGTSRLSASLARLSPSDEMDIGQIYFLLPAHILDAPLTIADVTPLLSKASLARKASYKGSQLAPSPLPLRRPSPFNEDDDDDNDDDDEDDITVRQRSVTREFAQRVIAEARLQLQKRSAADPTLSKELGSNPELQSAFADHIIARSCARLWRPPLDTIYEDPSVAISS